MLSNQHFYFQLTRKYVVLFGTLFNNIVFVKTNRLTGDEIERQRVPILYAPKEKYIARIESDPDLTREAQVVLPRMSFDLTGMTYDANRKLNSMMKNPKASTASRATSQYMGVPYDLNFELNVYTRNIDDGTQIVEQILPYFNPDYTVTIDSIPELGFLKDIPIILNSVSNSIEHEGNFDAVRYVTWKLEFTMKAYYYGPISYTNLIRKVTSNIYQDHGLGAMNHVLRLRLSNGNNGTFKIGDVVFQGNRYDTANAYGVVVEWSPTTGWLEIDKVQGTFYANNIIKASTSNSSYTISSFDAAPMKVVTITTQPKPLTASPSDDFGYDQTIQEWPNTTT
jgi:hypothetical protein